MAAWKVACAAAGTVTLMIPPGTYYIGPCKASALTFLLQGTLKAATDLKCFGNDWIEASKFFYIALLNNNNIKLLNLRINAPSNSPNTDGIHIERSTGVVIADTRIGTGDDCISIGQGNDNIDIAHVHCGPGHGMSVGSLGRYVGEGDVTRIHVKDMTFEGTMNGVRIKTWENFPTKSLAAHMVFENMVMKDVKNPIIIDQKYCPYYNCEHKYVSGVTIKDITFRNIKGTSSLPVAACSGAAFRARAWCCRTSTSSTRDRAVPPQSARMSRPST
ncbi:hypothetical protein ACQ4PT_035308 [Festuca glaucescens]